MDLLFSIYIKIIQNKYSMKSSQGSEENVWFACMHLFRKLYNGIQLRVRVSAMLFALRRFNSHRFNRWVSNFVQL